MQARSASKASVMEALRGEEQPITFGGYEIQFTLAREGSYKYTFWARWANCLTVGKHKVLLRMRRRSSQACRLYGELWYCNHSMLSLHATPPCMDCGEELDLRAQQAQW